MENILNTIGLWINNVILSPISIALLGFFTSTGLLGYLGTKAYKWLLKTLEKQLTQELLNPVAQKKVADKIDALVDELQVKNPEAGKETRKSVILALKTLIKTCQKVISSLEEADGVN